MNKFIVPKIGKDAQKSTDPNDFIFHSDYNTFKIIKTDIVTFTVNAGVTADFTQAHGLAFTPLVTAFALEGAQTRVFPPNSSNVSSSPAGVGFIDSGLKFNSISADATSIICNFTNSSGVNKSVRVRYYCLETI